MSRSRLSPLHYSVLMALVEASKNGSVWVPTESVVMPLYRRTQESRSTYSVAGLLRTLYLNDMVEREYAQSGPPWVYWSAK